MILKGETNASQLGSAFPLRFLAEAVVPKPEGPTILEGNPSLLFQREQIRFLQKLARDLQQLICAIHESRHHRASTEALLRSDVFTALNAVINNPHPGISRFHCSQCAAIDRFKIEYGLLPRHSLRRLRYMLQPQMLPPGLHSLGEEIYRVGQYAIFLGTYRGQKILIPVLNDLTITDRQKIFETVLKIREEERHSGSFISIKLDEILLEREKIAEGMGRSDRRLIDASIYASVGLLELFPLLLDDLIAEFYVDRGESFAYLDHRELGRCLSSVFIKASNMGRLITFARMASGKAMDYASPSLRVSLKTPGFNARISVDGPPLSLEGTSLSCRKFFISPLSAEDLVSNGTMPASLSSFLSAQVKERHNLTIYGESGSGKTTLAIALDLLTPLAWRKFSVESDVAENVSQSLMGFHQVRLLSAGTTPEEQAKRTHVLNSLLHKSPDYIFLGEVLSREDSVSLFQILAAGLKCIHTVHAETAEGLLRRWVYQHGIPPSSLHNLDLLIQMEKCMEASRVERRVVRVSRVEGEPGSNEIPLLSDIYRNSGAVLHLDAPPRQPCTMAMGAGRQDQPGGV
jgi:type IV secretory pathway ATPase VirB11/archaellum biosynthesis ATPase